MVLRFSMRHFSAASLVMKLMNSETHSWTHSLASFEILAVAGTLDFIILATFAILCRTCRSQGGGEERESQRRLGECAICQLTGRKRSCSLYSPTSCSVIGAGSGASGVVSGGALEPSLRGAIFGANSDDITALTKPWN